jgi:hypothetical protein
MYVESRMTGGRAAWLAWLLLAAACAPAAPGTATPSEYAPQASMEPLWNPSACLDALPESALRPETLFVRAYAYRFAPVFFVGVADLAAQVSLQLKMLLGASGDTLPQAEPRLTWRTIPLGADLVELRGERTVDVRRLPTGPSPDTRAQPLLERALRAALVTDSTLPGPPAGTTDSLVIAFQYRGLEWFHGGRAIDPPVPVMLVRAPHVDEQRPQRLGGPAPSYPSAARRERVNAIVLLEFVIDSTGGVEASSVHELPIREPGFDGGPYHQQFVESAIEAVRLSAFRPGRIANCAVRVRVQQPVSFFAGLRR